MTGDAVNFLNVCPPACAVRVYISENIAGGII